MRYLLVLLFLAAGCLAPRLPGSRPQEPELLTRAQAAIARDDWDDAAVLLGRLLREEPNSPWAHQARFLMGTYYLREHDLESAKREFEVVATQAEPSRLARQARLRLGDVAVAGREYTDAAQIYTRLLQDAKRHDDGAELNFKLGVVRQREGRWNEADAIFDRVRKESPRSVYAMRAAEQRALPHRFALQVGAFQKRANAERKLEELQKQGHEAAVHELQRHGRALFCVRIGSFETRREALQYLAKASRKDPEMRYSDVVP